MTEDQTSGELQITDSFSIPLSEFTFRATRSSGPGGQNVNKVSSKIMLRWLVLESPSIPVEILQRLRKLHGNRITSSGVFVISSERYRDQPRNKEECLRKLGDMLLEAATPPKARKKTRPSKGSQQRRLAEKKHRSEIKSTRKNYKSE
jgi:ribosome-associated protein